MHQLPVRCISCRVQILVKVSKILSIPDTLFIVREGEQHRSDLAKLNERFFCVRFECYQEGRVTLDARANSFPGITGTQDTSSFCRAPFYSSPPPFCRQTSLDTSLMMIPWLLYPKALHHAPPIFHLLIPFPLLRRAENVLSPTIAGSE
jgi:hypothetical protein